MGRSFLHCSSAWLKLSTKGVLFCFNLVLIAFLHPRVHACIESLGMLFSGVLFWHIIMSVMNRVSECRDSILRDNVMPGSYASI